MLTFPDFRYGAGVRFYITMSRASCNIILYPKTLNVNKKNQCRYRRYANWQLPDTMVRHPFTSCGGRGKNCAQRVNDLQKRFIRPRNHHDV